MSDANVPAVPLPSAAVSKLAAALAAAAAKTGRVAHDKTNDYHKYGYTSAEAVIAEAHDALSAAGISLVPIESTLDGYEREGCNRFSLHRKWLLIYPDGERLPISINWPVCPDKGRPLDKAFASALTTSLAYVLRDLLLMPRVSEEDDQAARDDRPAPPKPNVKTQATPAAARPVTSPASRGPAPPTPPRSYLDTYRRDPPPHGDALQEYVSECGDYLTSKGATVAGDVDKHLRDEWSNTPELLKQYGVWPPEWKQLDPGAIKYLWQVASTYARARMTNHARNGTTTAAV